MTSFQFDRIKIYDLKTEQGKPGENEDENNGLKIYKIEHMEVIYDMEPNRMIILRDITDVVQKEYNRSITKLSEIMVASTSHDMRTPLNTIINMHNIIEKKIKDPSILSLLKVARCSSNLLLNLVNDTLDYFQIRSGKFKIKCVPGTLSDLITGCLELIKIQMEQKQQEHRLHVDPQLEGLSFLFDH